jgi:hypothetical protein
VSVFLGAGVLTVIWCLLTIWVARTAQALGRTALWGLGAGIAGVLGVVAGVMLAARTFEDFDVSTSRAVFAFLMPPIGMVLPMLVVGFVVKREPIHVAMRGAWPVAFMGQGPGSITIDASRVVIAWKDTTRELGPEDALRAEADGECVRIKIGSEELVAMPMGKPATPAGRKHQSLLLARRLRMRGG